MRNLSLSPLLFALACTGDETTNEDSAEPVELERYDQVGPFNAGTYSADITGSSGVELTVQVWFPAEDGSQTVAYDGLIGGDAFTNATPSCATPRPVLLFSHGYGGVRWQSTYLMEYMASHGWVVVAPDHTYNTFVDNDDGQFYDLLFRRPEDIADSFDWVVSQSEDDTGDLAGCVNEADGYAVSGHSFGGYTAFMAAGATFEDPWGGAGEVELGDSRVWALAPLAPWNADVITDGASAVTVPVMVLSGTRDSTTTWTEVSSVYSHVGSTPRYLGEFPEAGHYSFAPFACMVGYQGNGCGDDYIDLDDLTGLVKTAMMAFLEDARGTVGAIEQLPEATEDLIWESEL
jgi:predicted dienelactone hydrolase